MRHICSIHVACGRAAGRGAGFCQGALHEAAAHGDRVQVGHQLRVEGDEVRLCLRGQETLSEENEYPADML